MKPSEVAALMAVLQAAYPNAPVTEQTCALYEQLLADLDASEVTAAVKRLIATSKWMPTVAEIRAEALGVKDAQAGVLAWGDVLAEIRRVGIYGKPAFDNPLTAEAVDVIGWATLCKSTNIAPERARFVEAYNACLTREGRRVVIDGVPGARLLERSEEAKPLHELVGAVLAKP